MAKLETLEDLLIHSVKDLYSAETQLVKALPKMAKAATDPDLVAAFKRHLEETKVHVTRLAEAAELLGGKPHGVTCKAMQGLVAEGAETIEGEAEPTIKDLALIAAAQKVEHYEISGYRSALALAGAIGNGEVGDLFQETLEEEEATDADLTAVADDLITAAGAEA